MFYSAFQIPVVHFDGLISCMGAEEYDCNAYDNVYESRRAVPTDVTIGLTVVPGDPDMLSVSAQVCLESAGNARSMRIYIVQVLDRWPADGGYHRNGFKQAAATEDISLTPGQCQVVDRTITLDAESLADQGNVRIIAWAQENSDTAPSEVYEAAVWAPEQDCNQNGIPDPADIAAGRSTDVNGNRTPDECEGLGDLNCDGSTDFDDINPFVAALVDRVSYEARYPECRWLNGNCNADCGVDFDDINPFVALLAQ